MFGHAPFWVVLVLVVFALGYRFYSRFVATRLFDCDSDEPTPATTLEDGVDYVPTNRHVLLGHHFTSIAGAAPIVGPAAACVHGWAPSLLWIGLGVVFIGAVHDFGSLVLSVRHEGKSLGDVAGDLVGPRARTLFLCLIVILTWLVLAAFASIIGKLFADCPASVVPINIEIPLAVAVGWWYYRRKGGIVWSSVIALTVMWGMVWVSSTTPSLQWALPKQVMGFTDVQVWIGLLMAYSFVTCILPVWVLLQPRDFINSHQLFVGLAALFAAIFLANPEMTAPAFNLTKPEGAGPIFPLLFVTIACGAVSGFHSLVASGTTSKQITSLRHARGIGYGGMLGEGCLALVATLCVAAGFQTRGDWRQIFDRPLAGGGLDAFVQGASNLLTRGFGDLVPASLAGDFEASVPTIVVVVVISFAATTLDTACRIQRYCLSELARGWNFRLLCNRYVAAGVAAFSPFLLCLETGHRPLWQHLWPVFGSANQMLGAIALLLVTLWLKRRGKPIVYTGVPAVFLTLVTTTGLVRLAWEQIERDPAQRKWAVLAPAVMLLALAIAVLWEGFRALLTRQRPDSTA